MAKRVLSEEEIVKDRLAYMGTLAGGLAHEVRSPLNSIHLNIELLERSGCRLDDEGEEKFQKRIGRIKEEVSNLQKTLTEFLQFARPPGVKRLATDIQDYIHDVVEFITPELEKEHISVKFKISEHSYPVLIDRRQMEQVIQNIIFNARDAMEKGGYITISTHEDDNNIMIRIEDEGPGIDEELKEKIFSAFFTTKKKGTGLGLGIAKRIVNEHNGNLTLVSPIKDGKGSSFQITLPKEKLLTHSTSMEEST